MDKPNEPPDPKLIAYRSSAADFVTAARDLMMAGSRLTDAAQQWDPASGKADDTYVTESARLAFWLLLTMKRSAGFVQMFDELARVQMVDDTPPIADVAVVDRTVVG